jgi:hypothetical protein
MSEQSFGDQLRLAARMLANGERDEIIMTDFQLQQITGKEKINPSHIRTTMGREVRTQGAISVKRTLDPLGYVCTFNPDPKKRAIASDELPSIKARAANKMLKEMLSIMPNVADLEGEQLQGAMVAIQRYQDLMKSKLNEEV